MDTQYFKLWYRLGSHDAYLIWRSNSVDGVVVDSIGCVPSFTSVDQLLRYSHKLGLKLVDEEPILHDLDQTAEWLVNTEHDLVDCDNLLAAWNLFADVSSSIGEKFDEDKIRTAAIYDKLFFGGETANNVLRPKEETPYKPEWSNAEISLLRDVLCKGLSIFERAVRRASEA